MIRYEVADTIFYFRNYDMDSLLDTITNEEDDDMLLYGLVIDNWWLFSKIHGDLMEDLGRYV